MSIKNNNSDQVGSRYRVMASYSRLKVNNRVLVLTSGPTPVVLTDFTATLMEEGAQG